MVTGIVLLILYFTKRKKGIKQSKARIVLPVISLCVGELFLAPICALIDLIILSNLTEVGVILIYILAAAVFIAGLVLIILSAVKAHCGKPLKSGLLWASLIIFLAGFEIFAVVAVYGLALLIL